VRNGTASRGAAVIGVFGLVFACIALIFGWNFFGDELKNGWRLRSWVEAPATLVEVSGHPRGMGAKYRYEYEGREYAGERVGFYDNWSGRTFNTLHAGNYKRLRDRLEASGPVRTTSYNKATSAHTLQPVRGGAGAPIRIWLNPKNPAEAVIDRSIRWDSLRVPMAICGALVAAGLLVAYLGFFGMRGASPAASAAAMQTRGPIRGSSHSFPAGSWLLGLAWNAIVAVQLIDFRPVRGREILAWVAVGVFTLVGLFIVWRALLATLRWARYRDLAIALDPYPGAAGGRVAGSLLVPVPHAPGHRFKAVLSATEHGLHGGRMGKNNSYARTLFSDESTAQATAVPAGTRLTFSFQLPPEAPPSEGYLEPISWRSATAERIFISWTLEISADVPGIDFEERFEIPVRRADPAAARPVQPAMASAGAVAGAAATMLAPASAKRASAATSATDRRPYVYERHGDRIRVSQPAWSKPGIGSFWSVAGGVALCALFAVIGVIVLGQGEWLIGGVFLLLGVAMTLGVLGYLAHDLSAEIGPAGITIERRLVGFRLKHLRLPRENIAAIEAVAESPAQGAPSALLRSVKVQMLNGETHTLAEMIPAEQDAVTLQKLVAARLAVGTAGSAAVAAATVHASPAPPAPAQGWTKWLGALGLVVFTGYFFYPFFKDFFRKPAPVEVAAVRAPVRIEPPLAADDWQGHFMRAHQAQIEQRLGDAAAGYRQALAIVERSRGADDPLAAAALNQIATVHELQKDRAAQEAALKRALAILERHSPKAVKAEAAKLVMFDKESVLRSLGDAYWEQRRYAEALAHYQRAYHAVPELETDEANRNFKLAFSSAGIMVTACMLGDWPLADRAMAELKERFPRVSPASQRKLKYWIDTGEPRLSARKC